MKRAMAFAIFGMLLLSGCAQQTDVMGPSAEESGEESPQLQALERAEQAGLLDMSEDAHETLTEEEALNAVTQPLDASQYTAAMTDEVLSIGAETSEARAYFVVEVNGADGKPVGKVAVDQETGERYNYLGDGVLEDYATFPLYDPTVDGVGGWEGTYKGPVSILLEITRDTPDTLTYLFSDGTQGTASVSGETARSEDGDINFLLAENIITVAGGGLTGNYVAQLS